ncbi:putative Ethanolamine ammonia-lyase heavy chain [Paratrimastix pyriformis]|uniref:Ethanolamine ammonia-lyase heavy chain n=1 Tax=Paratrimastix pyriformis TaxID=342808 RepID=A0ABQ8UMZ9_9EUKA|nr:putative Ethanolamine ammonia-lyase heavy chain [Paratrimastix pyriformis]
MQDPSILTDIRADDSVFSYVERKCGGFDQAIYQMLVGFANEFKEGDLSEGVGLPRDDAVRRSNARVLLSNTRISQIHENPVGIRDEVQKFIWDTTDTAGPAWDTIKDMTLADLKRFVLTHPEDDIKQIMPALDSDVVGCLVKLMSDEELIHVGQTVFNPLPGSHIGAKGYMSARVQPNSPTSNADDILMQTLCAFSYGVGDLILGSNPVSSQPDDVLSVERTLREVVEAFHLDLPWCVLAHIDIQADLEKKAPGSTAIHFQSLAGCDTALKIFGDLSVAKLRAHAQSRTRERGRFGLYFETGQGADATNGQGHHFDMVIHECRDYALCRGLIRDVAAARAKDPIPPGTPAVELEPWVHINDVAGFIGPEAFKSREQLVRCCLEDIAMGKLMGLCHGLDICATMHMSLTLEDLDWCMDHIMPANPAYIMALPTKNDPMLSYMTTAFQDHVRIRERFGYKIDDRMAAFYADVLRVVDRAGHPGEHFGDVSWVYRCYMRARGDTRPDGVLLAEGAAKAAQVRERGVPVPTGHGPQPWDLDPEVNRRIHDLFHQAKQAIWSELTPSFVAERVPCPLLVRTQAGTRARYLDRPPLGEVLAEESALAVAALRAGWIEKRRAEEMGAMATELAVSLPGGGRPEGGDGGAARLAAPYDVQIIVSDGLNALAIMAPDHLGPYLTALREALAAIYLRCAPRSSSAAKGGSPLPSCTSHTRTCASLHLWAAGAGRVRVGYRIGEQLFGPDAEVHPDSCRCVVHVIGERPGTGHNAFSVYLTGVPCWLWARPGRVDHQHTACISGIAATCLAPQAAGRQTAAMLAEMLARWAKMPAHSHRTHDAQPDA